jgi:hypothetical protein
MGDAYYKSVFSLIFGILSIHNFILPIPFLGLVIGLVFGIMGLNFARMSRNELDYQNNQTVQWLALAGKICCILGICMNLLLIAAVILFSLNGFT